MQKSIKTCRARTSEIRHAFNQHNVWCTCHFPAQVNDDGDEIQDNCEMEVAHISRHDK